MLVRRILVSIPLLGFVSLAAFGLLSVLPGDAASAIAGEYASAAQVEQVREQLGLDQPFVSRYADWVGNAVQGDLGQSMVTRTDLSDEIIRRAPVTISVTLGAVLFIVALGLPMGLAQGMRSGGRLDEALRTVTSLGLAVPDYWLGTILVSLVAVQLGWFPAFGYVPFTESPSLWAAHLVLPVIALGLSPMAEFARQLRAGLLQVQGEKYVRTAWAKGLPGWKVTGKHAMKNAAMAVTTILGMRTISLLGGAVIIELIFGLPGIGQMTLNAVLRQDITAIQALVLVTGIVVVLINLLVDLVYAILDPRVRVN